MNNFNNPMKSLFVKTAITRYLTCILIVIISASLFSGCETGFIGLSTNYDKDKINSSVLEGNTQFAFDIFKELNKDEGSNNIFISPLSISTALSMTYNGARGSTKEAMAEALSYEGIDIAVLNESYRNLLNYLESVDKKVSLNINNSIWIREGQEIKEDFIKINKDDYSAEVSQLDFSKADSADKINNWISDATKGKIDKMIDPPIPADVMMYLINAIYFKGHWSEQFDEKLTFTTKFTDDAGKKADVQMMSRKGNVEYGQSEDFKAVRLPFGKEKVAMYCVLPDEGVKLNDFIIGMDIKRWNVIKNSITEQEDVILQLPKFKMEYGIKKLNDTLINLGMGDAFSENADFSGMREGLFISRVLHKAVIEVNEKGSEAAGVTVVEMKESAAMEPLKFVADRPFLFVIEESETGTILFMGKMEKVN